jgi:hypothetical protein
MGWRRARLFDIFPSGERRERQCLQANSSLADVAKRAGITLPRVSEIQVVEHPAY